MQFLQSLQTHLHFYFYICPLSDKSLNGYIMLGEKLRELREARGLLQRQVAARLNVDTAYISKMERNDKPVSQAHIKELASLFEIQEKDLIIYWIAEKIKKVIKNEKYSKDALEIVLKDLKYGKHKAY